MKFQGRTYCQSQIIEIESRPSLKKWFFWSDPYKIEDLEMQLQNFVHMSICTI